MLRKNKFVFLISLLLISGFLITSLASYFVSRTSLRSEISENELPLTSDNIYSEIQRDLLQPIFISSVMANDTFLKDWVLSGEKDPRLITKYLKAIQVQYNTFTSFFVSEASRVYYHADGILKNIKENEKRDEWYFRVSKMKNNFEINVDNDMAHEDALTIFINYKVFDYDEKYIGATGVGLNVFAVKKLIETYQKRYSRNIYFIDHSGDITLQSTAQLLPADNINKFEGLKRFAREIINSDKNAFQFKIKGITHHVNTRYIPEFNWYLIVEQSDDQAVKSIYNTLLINIFICLFITLVVFILLNHLINSYQRKLKKMATTDKLTGLMNRQAFDIVIDQTLKDVIRHPWPLSMIMMDVDLFKSINDKHGHQVGDEVLKILSQILNENTRDSDISCRWGGEEFLILLKDCDLENAYLMAEKIRLAIEERQLKIHGVNLNVTASFGVVEYHSRDDAASLFSRADQALYQAKEKGRNRTVQLQK